MIDVLEEKFQNLGIQNYQKGLILLLENLVLSFDRDFQKTNSNKKFVSLLSFSEERVRLLRIKSPIIYWQQKQEKKSTPYLKKRVFRNQDNIEN